MKKNIWYIRKLILLVIVCIRLLFYCVIHPKNIFRLFFSIFSSINEFYQVSHGQLHNFEGTKTFQNIVNSKILAKNDVFNMDFHVTRPRETQVLSTLVRWFQPRTIFEIGTYNGFTTLHFAVNSPEDCKIITLDLPPDFDKKITKIGSRYSYDDMLVIQLSMEHINRRIYKSYSQASKITELFGDSSQFDFFPYYGKMDMVFVDGNHSYAFVKSDTEQAMKMLSDNGVIVWHDYDYIIHRDIFKYLNKLSQIYKIYSIPNTRFAIYGKNLS